MYLSELLLLRALSCWASFLSSLTHSVTLHSSVCYSTDVSVVMISDVTRTGICIIEFSQTEEQRRVGMPLPCELREDWLSFLNNCSLGSEQFSLSCKEQTLTVACVWFILLLDLITCKVPSTYQNPDWPSSEASIQNIAALLKSSVVFPLSLRIKSTLMSLSSSPSQSHFTLSKLEAGPGSS